MPRHGDNEEVNNILLNAQMPKKLHCIEHGISFESLADYADHMRTHTKYDRLLEKDEFGPTVTKGE
jgi:hypothetical protein